MRNIYVERKDYSIERNGSRYLVFVCGTNGQRLAGIFTAWDNADNFIRNRCEPKEFPAPVFNDICRCGASSRGWDYVETDGIIYELCNDCKNPLRHNVMVELNKKYLVDFDLDEFLNL